MNPSAPSSQVPGTAQGDKDGGTILIEVVSRALATTYQRASNDAGLPSLPCQIWANKMSGHWIVSLRDAFQRQYGTESGSDPVVVFGGKPDGGELESEMSPFGVKGWKRREFMYDLSVVRMSHVGAASGTIPGEPGIPKQIPVIKRAVWLVESEMAKNGTAVAEDVSKLHIGRSDFSLLVAAKVTRGESERWLTFIGQAMDGICGEAFLALIPTYASGDKSSTDWIDKAVEVDLYRCLGADRPHHFATVTCSGP
jgi:hypothetical protein